MFRNCIALDDRIDGSKERLLIGSNKGWLRFIVLVMIMPTK